MINFIDILCNEYYKKFPETVAPEDVRNKQLKKDFQLFLQGLYPLTVEGVTEVNTINGPYKIKLIYNPFIVLSKNAVCALNAGTYCDITVVFTDNLFNNLSANGKRFMIFHELGHRVHGLKYRRMTDDEEAADSFAAENNIDVVSALTECRDKVSKNRFIMTAEIEKRITAASTASVTA